MEVLVEPWTDSKDGSALKMYGRWRDKVMPVVDHLMLTLAVNGYLAMDKAIVWNSSIYLVSLECSLSKATMI